MLEGERWLALRDANVKPMVMVGGGLNVLSGLLNILVGILYLFVCYGVIVIPIGIWQVITGGIALTGKRVPTNLTAACFGVFASLITFDLLGIFACGAAALALGVELFQPDPE